MRKTVLSIAVWLVATTAAAVVAWAAVGVVGDQVADTAAIPLSAEEVDALGAARSTTTVAAVTTTTAPAPSTSEAVASTVTVPATTSNGPATTATAAPGDEQVAAYRLTGGSVVVRWSAAGGVTLVSATPESGWTVDLDTAGPPSVEVEFKGPGGSESKFSAQIDGGELRVETGD